MHRHMGCHGLCVCVCWWWQWQVCVSGAAEHPTHHTHTQHMQVAVSHLTTPAVLLLAATPVAVLGASLPLWAGGLLGPWPLLLATAALTGLGNSTGCVRKGAT